MLREITTGRRLRTTKDYDTWFNNLRQNVKTSDDVFTPPKVYEILLEYINEKIIPINSIEIQRPFFPGGDYQKDIENYNEKSVVIDNPPFSLTGEILDFYIKNNVKFFIFTNGITVFSYLNRDLHLLCPYITLEYENGARINTCFIHNLKPKGVTISAELRDKLKEVSKKRLVKRKKYEYPNEVLSVAESLRLSQTIKGEVTIESYRGVSEFDSNGKRNRIFCKAMILSKSEQEKIDKIRAELIRQDLTNDKIIKLELSPKQQKYREELENKD